MECSFFALLIVIIIGFLQGFVGLDSAEDHKVDTTFFILESMVKAILQSPEFDGFGDFARMCPLLSADVSGSMC